MNDPSAWRIATVAKITDETPTVKTFQFSFDSEVKHNAGQHYEIRLTAEGGYQAARLYSAASPGVGDNHLELTIALLPDGELSTYMHEQVRLGDQVEIRGPLGKFFVWYPALTESVLLIGGGTGVVPFRCMRAEHGLAGSIAPMRLIYSVRSPEEVIFKSELLHAPDTTVTLTGQIPGGWNGRIGRIDAELIKTELAKVSSPAVLYICGATPFVEAMADLAVGLGVPADRIKTERFGATLSK